MTAPLAVTGEAEAFEQETIDRLENHNFDRHPLAAMAQPATSISPPSSACAAASPPCPNRDGLTRAQAGPDIQALEAVVRDSRLADLAKSGGGRRAPLVRSARCRTTAIFPPPNTPISWAASSSSWPARRAIFRRTGSPASSSIAKITEGDLDTLSNRISHVRTWTFIANRGNWLKAPLYWQQRASEIEEKLSDALHERLTQRFIDRRTSVLMRRLAQKEELMSSVEEDGAIHVEGEYVGRIKGFNFIPDGTSESQEQRTLKAAAVQP